MNPPPPDPLAVTLAYHARTKHHPGRFARSLGYMDWATQPDPFRRYHGAPLHALDLVPVAPDEDGAGPRYERAFLEGPAGSAGQIPPAPLDRRAISQLFQDALGLSAWKEAGSARWSLRVNPSSGNLHPTEGYLIAPAVAGLVDSPGVFHYAPHEHALEGRVALDEETWRALVAPLPVGTVLVGLTSIHWREAWKYGERAFRYCHHDVGHAIAAIAVAAAGLGWRCRLLDGVAGRDLAALLGVEEQTGPEAEHADGLLALFPSTGALVDAEQLGYTPPATALASLRHAAWMGSPSRLSPEHVAWPEIDEVAAATERPRSATPPAPEPFTLPNPSLVVGEAPLGLRRIVHQRRSAVDLDGRTGITRDAFYQILLKALPGDGQVPFTALPWRPRIDLLLFVHRVQDVTPGLYALARDPARLDALRGALSPRFAWIRPPGCPSSLPLHLLEEGDARRAAAQSSCGQDIAADGVFAAAMLAEYRPSLERHGAWFYRRLHWEAGAVGQILYLEAEASGIRGTGIGCFFDDVSHHLTFGVTDDRFQVLYHFTMGGPVEDDRLRTCPPYEHLAHRASR